MVSCIVILDSMQSGNWRFVLMLLAGIAFLTFIFLVVFLTESVRYLFVIGRQEEALEVLGVMIKENNPGKMFYIEDEEKRERL